MIYRYLDASRWQGTIDWDTVKRSGKVDGAILKTVSTNKSFGGVYIDPSASAWASPWVPITTPTPRTRLPGPSSW